MKHWTQANTSDFAYSISLDFFTQIEDCLERSDISRKEFSKKLGVSPSAVSQLLNDPGDNPQVQTLVQYARTLGRKVAIVLYDDNDPDDGNGPVYSGVFEKAWEALGRPRDLSAFSGAIGENPTALLVPVEDQRNVLVAEDDSIDIKKAAAVYATSNNATGGDWHAQQIQQSAA